MFKTEAHLHTYPVSSCAKLTPVEQVRLFKEAGYDTIIVSDHFSPHHFKKLGEDLTFAQKVDKLCDAYLEAKAEMEKVGFNADSEEATADANAALAWVMEQDASRSSWTHNLQTLVQLGEINRGHYGILASLIPAWNKSVEREAERKAKQAAYAHSEHVGEVGERITIEVASAEVVTTWETEWGLVWLVRFVSKDGNVFMWRKTACIDMEIEKVKTVKGTVKSHDEFRGVKQTFLTRCKCA